MTDNLNKQRELIKEINYMFLDVPFKEQNDFSIRIDYDPIKNCNHLSINMRIYDGALMRDYHFPSLWVPKPTIFQISTQIIERFYNDINGLGVSGYLAELKDFIKETKEKFIEELTFNIPYENIKSKQDTPLDEITEKAIKEVLSI